MRTTSSRIGDDAGGDPRQHTAGRRSHTTVSAMHTVAGAGAAAPTPRRAGTALRVLVVESQAADAALLRGRLAEGVPDVEITHTVCLEDAVAAVLAVDFDLALVDLSLPDAIDQDGVLSLLRARPELAVVVLTGRDDGGLARAALSAGAQDHLRKDDLDAEQLARAVRYAVALADARDAREWAQSVLDAIDAPTCVLDEAGSIIAVNGAWRRSSAPSVSLPEQCGLGDSYLAVCDATDDPQVRQLAVDLRRLLSTGVGRIEFDYACPGRDQPRWFTLRATPAVGRGAAVITHLDVTSLMQAREELDRAATRDPLTGVATRRSLVRDLTARLSRPGGAPAVAAVFLDLDRFRVLNDRHGHAVGDGVLVHVAATVTSAVRQGDLVARHGSDQFVVLADVGDETEARALATRLHAALHRTIRVADVEIELGVSVGVAVSATGSDDDADDVLQAVDAAMREAKGQGRGRVEVYSARSRGRAVQHTRLCRELALAVERREFVLHFQPIVASDVGGVHAVEALIRWQHPQRGLLQPADFLDAAEATGLIVPMGALVIEQACRQGRRLHDAGHPVAVTVNLSAKQFDDPGTADLIRAALADSGFPPHSLVVEVTELTMLEDTPGVLAAMQAVKALGVQLAIDDFGTGYASLAYLKRYPIDGLKIDRSFVRDVLDSNDDQAIVASVVTLARDLDLWVIAEGVETPEQLGVVTGLGCHLIQGYLFSKPVPPDDLLGTLRALSAAPAAPVVPVQRTDPDRAAAGATDTRR